MQLAHSPVTKNSTVGLPVGRLKAEPEIVFTDSATGAGPAFPEIVAQRHLWPGRAWLQARR